MSIDLRKAAMAGVAGTAVMTMVGLWGAPMMGLPEMNPAEMLAGAPRVPGRSPSRPHSGG